MKKIEFQKAENNFTLIIFGASGSLAKLKLFPAIYELVKEKRMPTIFNIVGYGRSKMTDEDFRIHFKKALKEKNPDLDEMTLDKLLKNIFYVEGDYNNPSDFKILLKKIKEVERGKGLIRMAYFSVPPSTFDSIFKNMGVLNFNTKKSKLRLIIEKPFGYDLKSAKKLEKTLKIFFTDEQIFLLDHYLGKESVTNLLSLRYANSILTTLLRKEYIQNIQINALESKDIEGRANYFDHVGILRDMLQSHLLQILAYLTMDMPKQKDFESIHHEKAKILKSIKIKNIKNSIVMGQYDLYEKSVNRASNTETFAALKLFLKHPLWKGVPIYMRTGKALKTQWTSIVLEFKKNAELAPNRIVIQLQPYEKIEFHLLTKLGGKTFTFHELTTGRPIYCSGDCLLEHGRLLLDVIAGKKALFLNFEEVFAAWKVIDTLQKYCNKMKKNKSHLKIYKTATFGPKAADQLLVKDGFEWFNI